MDEYASFDTPDAYGDRCAEFYDEIYPPPSRASLQRLAELADGGPALDAGCGTGRYVLALAALGIPAHGIDASAAMLAKLRAKPGGDAVGVTQGDFSNASAPGRFRLVMCVVDTLALLPDRDSQERAVGRFAASLAADGALLLETTVDARRDAHRVDVSLTTSTGPRAYSSRLCPVDVDDLDGWAAQAGLRVDARWRNWHAAPWHGDAGSVISVYRRAAS